MTKTAARPMAKHVFIEREIVVQKASGIILLEENKLERKEALYRGTVLAVGGGVWDQLVVGAKVLFSQGEASEVNLGDDQWIFVVPQGGVLAVEEG